MEKIVKKAAKHLFASTSDMKDFYIAIIRPTLA